MRLLALDLSSKTGWALFESIQDAKAKPKDHGLLTLKKTVKDFGEFPSNYLIAAKSQAKLVLDLVKEKEPNIVVIEEINLGRSRYTQKYLDFLHCCIIDGLVEDGVKTVYISSSSWRKKLTITNSKEDRAANTALSKAKSLAKKQGVALDKKTLGIKGKITKKHLAVRWCNENFGYDFKISDNDICDAICLGCSYLMGAELCDGT